eukprot:gene17271-13471_t
MVANLMLLALLSSAVINGATPGSLTSVEEEFGLSTTSLAAIGVTLIGVGTCSFWTLAPVHVDNNIRKDLPLVPKFISWYMTCTPFGAVLGFVLVGGVQALFCAPGGGAGSGDGD